MWLGPYTSLTFLGIEVDTGASQLLLPLPLLKLKQGKKKTINLHPEQIIPMLLLLPTLYNFVITITLRAL